MNDSRGVSIPFANVLLLNPADSTLVLGTVASDDGYYTLKSIVPGKYLIMGTMIGYSSIYSPPFDLISDYSANPLILSEGENLEEVNISVAKPLYQQKIDRLVINVESSIVSAGGSALEILERSPGVLVNRQSKLISILGKEGVVVMINGKNNYVPVSALIQMLEGMRAENISSIELITTPPANFDAEGNAGFINIVLKKRTDLGFNGSFSLSAGYSNDYITSNNINLNYRTEKIYLFGNYSFSLDGTNQSMEFYREYIQNGDMITTETFSERDPLQRNHNLRLGMDYQVTSKTMTGFTLNGYDNRWSMDALNSSLTTVNKNPSFYVDLLNEEVNHWKHFGVNYNIKHNFTEDHFLSLDLDYLYYRDNNPTSYENIFFDGDRNFSNTQFTRSDKFTPIKIRVAKLDHSFMWNAIKIETGIKGIKTHFENDVKVETLSSSVWIPDPGLTNFSELDESIYAAYGAMDFIINDKTSFKAGLRYEFTDSQLVTDTQGKVVDRQYGLFFPSIFFNRTITENFNINISWSRRITRPTFNDLAPFVILLDPNTFISGNASLQPAISDAYKIDLGYKSAVLSFHYTDEEFTIASFQERIDEETGRLIFEAANLDYTKTMGVTLGFPLKIISWWRLQNNFNLVSQKVRGFYYEEPVEVSLNNVTANIIQSLNFSKTYTAELSGFYTSKSFFGTAIYDPVYRLNFGLQKEFGETEGILRFAVNDIFDSFEFRGGTNLPAQNLRTRNLFDFSARTFTLNYSRSLGNKNLKSRTRETGAEEERRRIN
ncbi:outer membrane beta-barrel family protein [Zunongwangia sp. F260]|uniref:Outer membrane beta-barrel family protein n=1 Tax=Autumnicola lenta TaxID=3075593 RepID=A0ABU3CJA3_9FLAO|nr:outer membrane beta-barrel family protein [Zunongwangia sp. F260]MDT0646302.1 outer membrane beta-barrel family protein [Zunongwangia sp. F260]